MSTSIKVASFIIFIYSSCAYVGCVHLTYSQKLDEIDQFDKDCYRTIERKIWRLQDAHSQKFQELIAFREDNPDVSLESTLREFAYQYEKSLKALVKQLQESGGGGGGGDSAEVAALQAADQRHR